VPADALYLHDATIATFDSEVTAVDSDGRVALAATAFYATGGGQPHDTGRLSWSGGDAQVTDVSKADGEHWHTIDGPTPAVGEAVTGTIDWGRRHQLMRTHTALHILCGVIWNEWEKPVTGGNMKPLEARMDFEFNPLPDGFAERVEQMVNDEIAADRPIEVTFVPRAEAVLDAELIRTKVSLVPETVTEVRIVDIVGLDKQADGGTHVASTGEVGGLRVVKSESKGKGFRRLQVEITDG
jgi:misacylated tRNA(Ala) deacylase